jgi:ATP-dependent Clp protease adaptor protein ClpS
MIESQATGGKTFSGPRTRPYAVPLYIAGLLWYSRRPYWHGEYMTTGNGATTGPTGHVATRSDSAVKRPELYRVLMHNDDFTSMDFVVQVLVEIFQRPPAEATQVMLDIHNKGSGTAGIYSYDSAMSKMYQVHRFAEDREFPLRCTIEKA